MFPLSKFKKMFCNKIFVSWEVSKPALPENSKKVITMSCHVKPLGEPQLSDTDMQWIEFLSQICL